MPTPTPTPGPLGGNPPTGDEYGFTDDDLFGSGQGEIPPDVYARYTKGEATDEDLIILVQADEITPGQAQEYRSKNGDALGGLMDDLKGLGLTPVDPEPDNPTPYYLRKGGDDATFFESPYGELYDRKGIVGSDRLKRLGVLGVGSGSDPYAGNRDARDATRLQEQIRAQRIQEVQAAQDAIMQRQQARLEGARYAVTPSMRASGGYFPGLEPNSPLVNTGLAQPLQYQNVSYAPDAAADPAQIQRDLALLRGGMQ